ncbi:helix-turn-helix domain-containing protein [Streptomyces sp. NBC_01433]|uniref:helix-turn-helix domain-containing protein n=1 Tax=Streptomyces sp. NBC_01433 TaxID=2903864 RepID=UPI00338E0B33
MTWSSPFAVLRNSDQLALSRELVSSRTAPLRRVRRAHVALACAHGTANAVIARTLRPHPDTVRRRRKRFTAEGLAALEDRPRPGHPRRCGPGVHLAILATVTSVRPEDPGFYTKAAAVCALHLHHPPGSVVLSVDERTAMRARSRGHPTRRAHPGPPTPAPRRVRLPPAPRSRQPDPRRISAAKRRTVSSRSRTRPGASRSGRAGCRCGVSVPRPAPTARPRSPCSRSSRG